MSKTYRYNGDNTKAYANKQQEKKHDNKAQGRKAK
jgi:hypothetical protein